ncbi:hydrogenase small subunit [Sporomusa termitida]|uniref:Uptake hydrogenase small subunit n=1 Tax=Sporomusa termitida TaxID=2377 RepID=A0A517DPU3_9FIRM|nr:hydrogenase small subunit [Sporomusa termitida]QDR79328.1 Uptake hydrogenase small subunit [Sporomusa termitida]
MSYNQSLGDLLQNRNLSRRQFIKVCCALTGMLGLSPSMLPEVIARAETRPLVPVIWLHGQACTGCSAAFLNAGEPSAAEAILNIMRLEYHGLFSAASGVELEHHREKVMREFRGNYLLIAEGAVPAGDQGYFCSVGGVPYGEILKAAAKQAAAVLAIGSCAVWGGIQAARPNPTQAAATQQVITNKPVVKIPGCPPIPEVIAGVVLHYSLFGQLPALDSQGRPTRFFGKTVHAGCSRKSFFEAGQFAEYYGDKGAKAGWCLYKLGCRGPSTFNSCAALGWWQGLSNPIQAGSPCIGCSEADFWDDDPISGFDVQG